MIRARVRLGTAALLLLAGCAQNTVQLGRNQPPPPQVVRRASNILPPQVLRGHNYSIDEQVVLDGYSYVFSMRTSYGDLSVKTLDLLELRLREMYSIQLAAQLSRQAHILEGVLAGLGNARAGLAALLNDPAGTVRQAPEGLRRKMDELFNPADRRAGSERRRALAARVGCDPETRNPILKSMLDEMAIRQQIGGFLTGSAMDAVLPGMSLLPTTAEMRQLVRSTPPHIINERIERELKASGFDAGLSEQFCRQASFTTLQRLIMLQCLRYLRGVPGGDALLSVAIAARSEAEALEAIHLAKFMAELHSGRGISSLFKAGMVGAVLRDGTYVLMLIADEVNDPEPLATQLAEFRRLLPEPAATLVTTARLQTSITPALKKHRISLP